MWLYACYAFFPLNESDKWSWGKTKNKDISFFGYLYQQCIYISYGIYGEIQVEYHYHKNKICSLVVFNWYSEYIQHSFQKITAFAVGIKNSLYVNKTNEKTDKVLINF